MLSVNQIAAIARAAGALRALGDVDNAMALEHIITNDSLTRAKISATRAKGKRGAPCRRYTVANGQGQAWVEHGAKAAAARLATVLRSMGSGRTPPSPQVLASALARGGWQCPVDTDNGLAMVTVQYAD